MATDKTEDLFCPFCGKEADLYVTDYGWLYASYGNKITSLEHYCKKTKINFLKQ